MLSRHSRFHGHKSLNFVYRNGKSTRDPRVTLRYVVNTRQDSCRVAVVVSKKVNKSAVKRNRIRRRIYEVVANEKIKGNYDLVFSVYNDELGNIKFEELRSTIRNLLINAGVI